MKPLLKISTSFSLQPDVFFILVSGKTGTALGGSVKYSTNGEGKVIGPEVYVTSQGAIYILFGFGKMDLAFPALTEKILVLAKKAQSIPGILLPYLLL